MKKLTKSPISEHCLSEVPRDGQPLFIGRGILFMIIIFDSQIDKPVVILNNLSLADSPLDDIKGDTFMQFGEGTDILKLPKNMQIVSIDGNRITFDYVEHKNSTPLHYWKP